MLSEITQECDSMTECDDDGDDDYDDDGDNDVAWQN